MKGAHLPRLKADGAVEIVCVADPDREQADSLVDRWGSEACYYDDYRQMVKEEDIDALLVSSPHALHYEQVRSGLQKGLHVCVEKPLTISSRHTKSLIALADRRKCYLQVAYQRHYYREYLHVRELIQRGTIGELRGIVAYVTQNWGGIRGWRLDPEMSGAACSWTPAATW